MPSFELSITRLIDAPRANIFRCWTEPELMKKWFCPRPWTTPVIETEVRAGGASYILMRGPNGEEMPMRGVYLEVVPNEKIVFTDAYTRAWEPSEKPFFTGIIQLTEEAGKTRYAASARHWREEDMKQHEAMGFYDGWNKATDQLEEVLKTL